MTSRHFDPWVGKEHWSKGLLGTRVLILGESHYGDKAAETSTVTAEVVRKYGQQQRDRFFTLAQKMVANIARAEWVSSERRVAFWEQVAFYNFVQCFPGEEPRCRPTQEMWEKAALPLLETIAELQPHVVVVLGKELGKHLPPIPSGIEVCVIQHPSSGAHRPNRSDSTAKPVPNIWHMPSRPAQHGQPLRYRA